MKVNGIKIPGIIDVSNVCVYGIKESIISSGYPMQQQIKDMREVNISEKDLQRACQLGKSKQGSGHDCFSKGIIVQMDLQWSEYMWRQWDRYHHNDYVSSQSKMHRLTKFNIDDMCNKYVVKNTINFLNELIYDYNNFQELKLTASDEVTLRNGENIRATKETLWKIIISNCPSELMLTARVTLNYLQIKSMINQRENHKMEEWRILCDFFKTLPKYKELMM
ncbi:hypothetical protein O0901_16630 [Clostridioides difficile]|nr:hypothetical protein [Clostridioides difficile]